MESSNSIGARLQQARRERGYSQEGLAELAGISASYIAKLEQDRAVSPSMRVLYKLCAALGVNASWLLDNRERLQQGGRDRSIQAVRDAIFAPGDIPGLDLAGGGAPAPVAELEKAVATGWDLYWDGHLGLLASLLPALIASARATERETGPSACKPLAQAYQLAADLFVHVGNDDLAFAGAMRAMRASIRSQGTEHHDPLQQATLAGTTSWVLLHMGRLAEAEKVAAAGADSIRPAGRVPFEHLTVHGALLLSAAAPAAAAGSKDAVAEYMAEAQVASLQFTEGDHHDYNVSFGPSQVAMQRTHQMTLLDEPGGALKASKRVIQADLLPISWGAFHLDVAQASLAARRVNAAVDALWTAHDVSPEWARHQGIWRSAVAGAVRAENRLSARTRKLAVVAGLR